MRPDANAMNILSTTRARAKMHEFRVAPEDFNALPRNPTMLFTLAIGLLGDVSATIANDEADVLAPVDAIPVPPNWGETGPTPINGLRFTSIFFDAFLNAQLDDTITTEFSLLCASAYYLAGNVGSATVIIRHMDLPELNLSGGLGRLIYTILRNDFVPIDGEHPHEGHTSAILKSLSGYMHFDNDAAAVQRACAELRSAAYANGSPRELIYADLTTAICASKLRHAARTMLPPSSGLDPDAWRPALAKSHFPVELWPAQQRIANAGMLLGRSAVIQMPTSAGKTRATELIIRSAFLANRASLAVIVAPYRSLCHDIRGDLLVAFAGEPISLDEASDSYQFDLELEALFANNTVLIVTPEKLLYMLRRAPELADRIGLVIYDEGHQFDGMTRGPTYELLLTSLKMALSPDAQIVLISAVIGNAANVAAWLIGDPDAVIGGDGLMPTAKSIAFASWQHARGRLQYVSPADPEEVEFWVPRIINDVVLPLRGKEKAERRFPERKDGGDVGLFLGLHVVSNGSVAIFCGRKDSAAKLCRRAVDIFERGVPYMRPLAVSDAAEVEKIRHLSEQHLGAQASATRAAALGIFAHHADTPQGLRLSIEHAMKDGLIKFVMCTSTLAQGVNFPLKYLIVTSTRQGGQKILVRDFHNLMGRAGRAGMHTEGSIIFSTPTVYDQRNIFAQRWRWNEAKDLLDASKSEPSTSAILAIFEDYVQRQPGAPPIVQPILSQWLDLAFADRDRIEAVVAEALALQPNIGANEFRKFIEGRARAVQSIAAFLVANMTFAAGEDIAARVSDLAANTLAYHLADDPTRERLVDIFRRIAEIISERTDEPYRLLIRRSPLPPAAVAELRTWLSDNIEPLRIAVAEDRLLEAVSASALRHVSASSIRNMSDSGAVSLALLEWVAGHSYAAIHALLVGRDVRVSGDRVTVEDVVALCENGFGYDVAMVIASLADLAEELDPGLQEALALLQRQIKSGLPDRSALAFMESGFVDRIVASTLAASWPEVLERGGVRAICRNRADEINAVLAAYPVYFTVVASDLRN
ncbi:DEAD/DEAH box helicase [Mesorhizobium sp. M6A.T.Ce.TU.016.01.1.1]|nr:DEAD/DEAH box helicase [Mesorhizobium sp. M6A.T.Ce.TU.016.01.1.1]